MRSLLICKELKRKKKAMAKRILVVAAHPDDEVLGCGATIYNYIQKGVEAFALILGEGITSRYKTRDRKAQSVELIELKRAINNAKVLIGYKEVSIYDFPDNRFDSVALLDVVKIVEEYKDKIKPTIVFTHHHNDLNIDHRITFQAVLTACRPIEGQTVKEIYSFEVPSSTEWQQAESNTIFCPTFFYVITEKDIEAKLKAMEIYDGELRPYPHPRSLEAIKILALYRGINCGYRYAEAFEVVRVIAERHLSAAYSL